MQWLNDIDDAFDRAFVARDKGKLKKRRPNSSNIERVDRNDIRRSAETQRVKKGKPSLTNITTIPNQFSNNASFQHSPINLHKTNISNNDHHKSMKSGKLPPISSTEYKTMLPLRNKTSNDPSPKSRIDSKLDAAPLKERKLNQPPANLSVGGAENTTITYQSWKERISHKQSSKTNEVLKSGQLGSNATTKIEAENREDIEGEQQTEMGISDRLCKNPNQSIVKKDSSIESIHIGLKNDVSNNVIHNGKERGVDNRLDTLDENTDNNDHIPENLFCYDSTSRLWQDFDSDSALPSWSQDTNTTPFDPKTMNRYGVVHVRILRAVKLPCSVGSTVQAVVSLSPWKGCVRNERAKSFLLDEFASFEDHGVCVQWGDDELTPEVSMIHAYSDEETPVPSIKIELMLTTLNLFEFSMCSLELSCDALMRQPDTWKRQWLVTTMQDIAAQVGPEADHKEAPLIELEALFVPFDHENPDAPIPIVSNITPTETSLRDFDDSIMPKTAISNIPAVNMSVDTGDEIDSTAPTLQSIPKPLSTKLHLLRLKTFWSPTVCCVCSSVIMVGWKQGLYCEACNNDFCGDCRLHADLQVPCGSEQAQHALEKKIKGKFTLNKVFETMAPVDERQKLEIEKNTTLESKKPDSKFGGDLHQNVGIGSLKLVLLEACIFKEAMPATMNPAELFSPKSSPYLRRGDYYVRVCWTGSPSSARTHTIQNSSGRLKFRSSEMKFDVSHYGVEYRIEVVDAATDKPVGTCLITTHSLLQQQRELIIQDQGFGVVQMKKGPPKFDGTRPLALELRTGVKTGFSPDFFVSSDEGTSTANSHPGQIIGWIELHAGISENVDGLFGLEAIECLSRPAGDLNLQILQIHLNRISSLIGDIKECSEVFVYVVGWENTSLTSLSLIFFVSLCIGFNPEYIGCLPFFFLLFYMIYYAWHRKKGTATDRFLQREADARREEEKTIAINYKIHRPLGVIDIQLRSGKNIRSLEGLPGKVYCRVYWDPLRYAKDKQNKDSVLYDKSVKTIHDIGFTESAYALNPVWNKVEESDESRRLKQFLPAEGTYFEYPTKDDNLHNFRFPVLQPLKVMDELIDESFDSVLAPWTDCAGAIVIEIRFRDILNMLPGSDHIFGEVSIPFSQLARNGDVSGWFRVLEAGATRVVPIPHKTTNEDLETKDTPQIYLELSWNPPNHIHTINDTERETSIAVQEELVRWSVTRKDSQVKETDNSKGAFSTVRGLSSRLLFVQNVLGTILDFLESSRNALNFTDPFKSSVILMVLWIPCLILAFIPTRYLVLAGGLGIYGSFFAKRFIIKSRPSAQVVSSETQSSGEGKTGVAFESLIESIRQALKAALGEDAGTWVMNAFKGLPTDDDLRKIRFWESRRIGVLEREMYATQKREVRLQRLWKAEWYSPVKIRRGGNKQTDTEELLWDHAFAILQGRRFLWWHSAFDFDEGKAPVGRIHFTGHAGLSNPSPLEMRQLESEKIPFVVIIFGKGLNKQERVTLLAPDLDTKNALETAVLEYLLRDS